MPLKIELKPKERIILGDCVVTNGDRRARLVIDGDVTILREKDIMSPEPSRQPGQAHLSGGAVHLHGQTTAGPPELYFRLTREFLTAAPDAKPLIENINKRILTGEPYKALKEARKLIAYEEEHSEMHYAANAYAKTALDTAAPRELEARLLLQAAAKLQAVYDSWRDKPLGLNEAVLYNRRLWTIFLDAVMSENNKLPVQVRDNLRRLGVFIMAETFSLMTNPKPDHLTSIIKINRGIAAGLRGKA